MTGDDRALHLGLIVPKTNGINELTGMSVALGVEGVDVADTPAHEEKNDRLGPGIEMRPQQGVLDFSALGPDAPQGSPEETAPCAMEKMTSRKMASRHALWMGVSGHR